MRRIVIVATTLSLVGILHAAPVASAEPRPRAYELQGDTDGVGSKFEGIAVDRATDTFYVSETTGGEIHRGSSDSPDTSVWLDGGTDGRYTARGMTVDGHGRLYVAGGPNSTDNPGAPDLWVYDRDGTLLAALNVPVMGAFINDVAMGPDGAAYFTNSLAPHIYRVAWSPSGWAATLWKDASSEVAQLPGFNFNGIVLTSTRNAFLVVQSNAGALWRIDARSGDVTQVDIGAAVLTSGDGLVLRGRKLAVVRNFPRTVTTLDLTDGARTAILRAEVATDPTRVFTTGKLDHGRLLLVDSKFDEPVATAPYEVVAIPFQDVLG